MNDMETERDLCSTIGTIHNGYYPKQIKEQFETAQSSSWCIRVYMYSHSQSGNT
jgi:hypothetical protein